MVFKCIDRLTRGGAGFYERLKTELVVAGVAPADTYGTIQPQVNRLAHLRISYPWSMISPSGIVEILQAMVAKEEHDNILTRTIGA